MGSLDEVKGEVVKNFEKLHSRYSNFCRDVKSWQSNGVAKFLLTPPGRSLDSMAKAIGQSARTVTSKSATAIQSSVSGVVKEFKTLRGNFERNVQALTAKSGTLDSQATSASIAASEEDFGEGLRQDLSANATSNSIPSTSSPSEEIFEEDPRRILSAKGTSNSISFPSNFYSTSSPSGEVAEEDVHPDLTSASATSVFSIGYLGPPLLGPLQSEGFGFSQEEVPKEGEDMAQGEGSGPLPVVLLEDVRRSIGKALVVYSRFRRLGFRKCSWENKMPWRNPRPRHLAKGLKWPQQKFSSVRERHEYHRRARRRGRYLIGPTPGWSWFAADIILLAFLINNPAGNFLL